MIVRCELCQDKRAEYFVRVRFIRGFGPIGSVLRANCPDCLRENFVDDYVSLEEGLAEWTVQQVHDT